MRIKEQIQRVLAVDREGVLTEVVRSDTEEINLFCQLIADDGSRRGLDHDTLLWISYSMPAQREKLLLPSQSL